MWVVIFDQGVGWGRVWSCGGAGALLSTGWRVVGFCGDVGVYQGSVCLGSSL